MLVHVERQCLEVRLKLHDLGLVLGFPIRHPHGADLELPEFGGATTKTDNVIHVAMRDDDERKAAAGFRCHVRDRAFDGVDVALAGLPGRDAAVDKNVLRPLCGRDGHQEEVTEADPVHPHPQPGNISGARGTTGSAGFLGRRPAPGAP